MKDRETKKYLLEEFVKENEIRSSELEMAYKRYTNLAPSSGGARAPQSAEVDFKTWVMVSNLPFLGRLLLVSVAFVGVLVHDPRYVPTVFVVYE